MTVLDATELAAIQARAGAWDEVCARADDGLLVPESARLVEATAADVPALLDEVARLRAELARAHVALARWWPVIATAMIWREMEPETGRPLAEQSALIAEIDTLDNPNDASSSQVASACSHIGGQVAECGHDGGDGTVCIKHVKVDPNDGERYHGGGHMFASLAVAARMRGPNRDAAALIAGMRRIPKGKASDGT